MRLSDTPGTIIDLAASGVVTERDRAVVPPLRLGKQKMTLVTIKEAAAVSGVSAKMIRHYESIGLIAPPARGENRYRHYSANEVHALGFIHRARDLGFSIEDIRQLLALWGDRGRPSSEVKAIALRHIAELDQKAAALAEMSRTLKHLADGCQGNHRPDCPILDALEPAS